MPHTGRKRRRAYARKKPAAWAFKPAALIAEQKPPRGVKLKTVSRLTLLFALLCLGAFLAGRPSVPGDAGANSGASGAGQTRSVPSARERLRNDNARRLFFSLGR